MKGRRARCVKTAYASCSTGTAEHPVAFKLLRYECVGCIVCLLVCLFFCFDLCVNEHMRVNNWVDTHEYSINCTCILSYTYEFTLVHIHITYLLTHKHVHITYLHSHTSRTYTQATAEGTLVSDPYELQTDWETANFDVRHANKGADGSSWWSKNIPGTFQEHSRDSERTFLGI